MPALAERLQAMIDAVERQGQAMNDRQLASQDAFQGAEAAYSRLAASVEQTLKASVADSARRRRGVATVVEATMTGLARETAALRDTVSDAVQRQLDGLSAGFRASTADVAGIWVRALDGQQRANETLANDLRVSLDQFASTFEQRSAALMDGMSTRMEASAGKLSDVWDGALSRQERAGEKLAGDNQQALAAAAAALERQSAALVQAVSQSHADLQAALMARDEQRLAAWNASLGSVSASLRQEWEQAAAQTAGRQQEICDALALTAQRISDHTQLQAGETIAEISRLVQAAADAPGRRRAAGRAGRARPGSPAGLDGHAGEHDRRAAPGMAAGRRRGGQPPARNLRCAVARRANHLRAGAHPGQRHAGRDQPAGRRRRRRAARPPSRCRTNWPRATASAWTPGAARWPR